MNRTLIFFLALLVFVSACTTSQPYTKESIDKLATCLSEKEVKEYGAFWCPNCAKQKKLFGNSYDILMESVYIECDPRGDNEQSEFCISKGIEQYPTWEFPDGEKIAKVFELKELDRKSECNKLVVK